MVKIRLKRMGAKKRPFYRLVVADSRSPRDGKFIESLGYYDPLPEPATCQIDADKVKLWLGKGARPSDSARRLLQQQGLLPKTPYVAPPKSAAQVAKEAAAEAAAQAEAAGAPDPEAAQGGEPAASGTESEPEAVAAEAGAEQGEA